jgi:hypothetical protein
MKRGQLVLFRTGAALKERRKDQSTSTTSLLLSTSSMTRRHYSTQQLPVPAELVGDAQISTPRSIRTFQIIWSTCHQEIPTCTLYNCRPAPSVSPTHKNRRPRSTTYEYTTRAVSHRYVSHNSQRTSATRRSCHISARHVYTLGLVWWLRLCSAVTPKFPPYISLTCHISVLFSLISPPCTAVLPKGVFENKVFL